MFFQSDATSDTNQTPQVRMGSFRRTTSYLVLFTFVFLGLSGVGLWFDIWRPFDYQLYRTLYLPSNGVVSLSKSIKVVDIEYPESLIQDRDPSEFRQNLAAFLTEVANNPGNPPRAIILDFWFPRDVRGRAPLKLAIETLQSNGIPVFATTSLKETGNQSHSDYWKDLDTPLYDTLTGYGHTSIVPYPGFLAYPCALKYRDSANDVMNALPVVVANSLDFQVANCVNGDGSTVLVAGKKRVIDGQTYKFIRGGNETVANRLVSVLEPVTEIDPKELRHSVIVVGSLAFDRPAASEQEGPKLVAWAINDLLSPMGTGRQPVTSLPILVILPLCFALFTVLCAAFLYKYIKGLQARPIPLVLLSVFASWGLIALTEWTFLSLGRVLPLGFSISVVLIVAVLIGRFQYIFLVSGEAEGSGKYDVFISYARDNKDWVTKQILQPLEAAGKKVFFDEKSIGLGTPFVSRYMWGIVDSRVFVPVFTEGYYDRPHCRNEADLAMHRRVSNKIRIIPVTRYSDAVPDIFAGLNSLDGNQPGFSSKLIEEVA